MLPRRPDWYDDILCRGQGDLFFSEKVADVAKARATCRRCPVRHPCLAAALEQNEEFGVFGGMTATERQSAVRNVRSVSASSLKRSERA